MNKKSVLASAFIYVLLVPVLVGVQFVNLASANPFSFPEQPPEPRDTNPPTISILSPENKTYTVNIVSLAFGVSEHIHGASYSLDGQVNVTIGNIPLVHGIGTFGNTTLTGLPDGMHSLIVYARDQAGNRGSSDMIYFTVDTTPPSISILSPENKTYETTDIPLNFTVDETVSWMAYSLNGQANVTVRNITLTGLAVDAHSLTIYAMDEAGNTGSEIIYFSIAKETEPFLRTWVETAVVSVAVVGLGFIVYFSKVKKTTEKNRIKTELPT